jgi:hypothetical protein
LQGEVALQSSRFNSGVVRKGNQVRLGMFQLLPCLFHLLFKERLLSSGTVKLSMFRQVCA